MNEEKKVSILVLLKEEASKKLKELESNYSGSMDKIRSVVNTGLAIGATAVTAAGAFIAKGAISQASAFEKYEATLKTMLGSTEKAKERLKEYSEIGKKTPSFELKDVVQLGNQLQAIGKYSKENVIMLGDMAAASGKPIEQVSGAFAKLATGQKGVAVDMFRDLLISTDDWTKATGKGINKNGELMASTQEMMAALPKIMNSKGFSGMMDAQSQTLEGKWSNLMDTINEKLRGLGEKILPVIKPIIDKVIEFIGNIDIDKFVNNIEIAFNGLKAFFEGDFDGVWEVLDNFFGKGVADLLTPLLENLKKFGDFLVENKDAVIFALSAVGIAIMASYVPAMLSAAAATLAATWPLLAIGAAAFLLYKMWTENWGGMRDKLTEFWNNYAKPVFDQVWGWLSTNIPIAMANLKAWWDEHWPAISQTLQNIWNNVLLPVFTAIGDVLKTVIPIAIDALKWAWDNVLVPIFDALKWAWENVGKPVVNFIIDFFKVAIPIALDVLKWAWDNILMPIWNTLKWIWDTIGKPIFDLVVGFFKWLIPEAIQKLKEKWNELQPLFQWIRDKYNEYIKPNVEKIVEWFKDKIPQAIDSFKAGFNDAKNKVNDFIQPIKDAIKWLGDLIDKINIFNKNTLKPLDAGVSGGKSANFAFASGTTYAPGGLSIVGEKGPELMNVPRGARITPANRTEDILSQRGGIALNFGDIVLQGGGDMRSQAAEFIQIVREEFAREFQLSRNGQNNGL